jgi:hypothetical protein
MDKIDKIDKIDTHQSWELINPKIETKIDKLVNILKSKDSEIEQLKVELTDLKIDLQDVKQIFQDWKEDLIQSRQERLQVLLDIKGMLKENRTVYMNEFSKNNQKSEEIKNSVSEEYLLRNTNRAWRSNTVVAPKVWKPPSCF